MSGPGRPDAGGQGRPAPRGRTKGAAQRLVVAISGASGPIYGIRLLQALNQAGVEVHLILSPWAEKTIAIETSWSVADVKALAQRVYAADNMAAAVSSGSFRHDGMVIAPCSMRTLAAIAHGLSDNLIARAADVTLKERRPLILVPRETPFNLIHLENMVRLHHAGAVIMPPVPSFYHRPQTIDDLLDHFTGRILDLLGIDNTLVGRWTEPIRRRGRRGEEETEC